MCYLVTGRWGYNKNFPGSPNEGGINIKRLRKNKPLNPLKITRKLIIYLLTIGEDESALDCLMECSASITQKEKFFEKYF